MTAHHVRTRTAWVLAVTVASYLCAAAALATVPPVLEHTGDLNAAELVATLGFGSAFLGLPAVGAMLAVHRPSNPIGTTLLAFGAGLFLLLFVGGTTELTMVRTGAVGELQLWVAGLFSAVGPVLLALAVHLLLFFPDGQLEGRARWLSRACIGVVGVVVVARLLRPGRLDAAVELPNPFGQTWATPLGGLVGPLTLVVVVFAVASLVRLVVRFRRADRIERAQFRWILLSLSSIPVALVVSILVDEVVGSELLTTSLIIGGYNVGVLGFSYALYRAVTKQDLYGIGRVISRSVSYAIVVAVLASAYLLLVLGLGAVMRALTGEASDLVVAVSTLAVAALFQPVRMRVRSMVDRRFNRARFDAGRTIDAFSRELRDEVSLDAVMARLTGVSRASFQPSLVGVTLVAGERP